MKNFEEYNKSVDEIAEEMDIMKKSISEQDNPCVGIFWYDAYKKELFGVCKDKIDPRTEKKTVTGKELHEHKWKVEYNKQKFKNNGNGPYKGDYRDIPRGRVFYKGSNKKFEICVGSWIKEHEDAKELIINEFDLWAYDFEFVINYHWDIGYGWENF